MDNYFKKAVVFADSHFGRSVDSPLANQDNLEFITWMIDRARSWGAETCIFLGDYYHNRSSIGVISLHHALLGLEKLSTAGFDRVVILLGNHDIARRQSRDISSLNFARHLPGIQVVNDPLMLGDVTFLPWLVGQEHAHLAQLRSRYVFAHLETIGAMMNARVACSGGEHAIEADTFAKSVEHAFCGHFHQRQTLRNITYIGSVMPFDFSDANDAARGAMFLEWGRDPFFEAWPDQPLYRTSTLSQLLSELDRLQPKTTIRLTLDIDLRFEEAQEIRDTLIRDYGLRKIELLNPAEPSEVVSVETTVLHSVDQIVIDGLQNIESIDLSNDKLISIFNALPRR